MALNIVGVDYNYKPKNNKGHQWAKGSNESMMYLPTFMTYSDCILSCHTPDINIAWVRSYDSWHAEDKNGYVLSTQGYSVVPPKAYAIVDGKQQELKRKSEGENNLIGSQRIILENDAIVGEAVYYDLKDVTKASAPVTLATNRIYRGGIDIPLESGTVKTYEIQTYDMSYDVKSDPVTYRVTLSDGQHKVIVHDLAASSDSSADSGGSSLSGQSAVSPQSTSSDGKGLALMAGSVPGGLLQTASDPGVARKREYTFSEGSRAFVEAGVPSARYFKTWKAEVLDADGKVVKDITAELLPNGAKSSEDAVFTMPKVDGATYKQGYQLQLTADYGTKITDIKLNPEAPVVNEELKSTVPASLLPAESHSGELSFVAAWSQRDEDGAIVPASGTAHPKTVYFAQLLIEQDPENDIVFETSNVKVELADGLDPDTVEIYEITRNTEEGAITLCCTRGMTRRFVLP